MISSNGQAADWPFSTQPMVQDPSSVRSSSPSIQGAYHVASASVPPDTPSPQSGGDSTVWPWSPTGRVRQMQPVPPHSSMSPNATWPPKPPPSFLRKHRLKFVVVALLGILIISSIIGFFLLQNPKPRQQVVLLPAHLIVSPSLLDFGKLPQGVKAVLAIKISNAGGRPLTWTADTGSTPWLTVQIKTPTIEPNSFQQLNTVMVDTGRLPLGASSAQLAIHSNGGNASITVKIEVLHSAEKQPKLDLSASSFNLGKLTAGTQVALTVTVSNIGTQVLRWSASAGNTSWLGVYNNNGTIQPGGQPETINMTVNTTGLAAGSYQTMLNIASNGGSQKVPISLIVPSLSPVTQPPATQPPATQPPVTQPPSVSPALLNMSPTSLTFGPMLANTAQTQHVTLSNTGGMPLSWSANSNQSWLKTNPTTGVIQPGIQQSVRVIVNTTGLAANNYSAILYIYSGGGDQQITVTLTVVLPPQLCNLSPGSTLNFGSVQQGKNLPSQQPLTFSNCGGEQLNWTASTGNTTWLSLSPYSGSVNPNQQGSATIQVTVDTSQLQPGPSTAIITFSTNESNGGNEQVTVSVTVTAPPSPIPSAPPSPPPLPSPGL